MAIGYGRELRPLFRSKSRRHSVRILIRGLVWLALFSGTGAVAEDRPNDPSAPSPVPSKKAQAEKKALIETLFEEEYSESQSLETKRKLAQILLEYAMDEDDSIARYVLLSEVERIAIESSAVDTLLKALELLSSKYAVDAPARKSQALTQILQNKADSDEVRGVPSRIADAISNAIREAIGLERFEIAESLGLALGAKAREVGSTELSQLMDLRVEQATRARRAETVVHRARVILLSNPDDADANLKVGRYWCFLVEDWTKGLPKLRAGSAEELAVLAGKDMESPELPNDQVELGESWLRLAEQEEFSLGIRYRAAHWYRKALPALLGEERDRVAAILANLPSGNTKAVASIDAAVEAKRSFEALYRSRLETVLQSESRKDDVELAAEIVAAARVSADKKQLVVLLCEHAYNLSKTSASGRSVAQAAVELALTAAPDPRLPWIERQITVLKRQFAAASKENRFTVGIPLAGAFLEVGDAHLTARKYADAVKAYREAIRVAKKTRLIVAQEIERDLESLHALERAERKTARLEESFETDKSSALAESIVLSHVFELDHVESARPFLDHVKNRDLEELVRLRAKPVTELSERECMKLGDFHRTPPAGLQLDPLSEALSLARAVQFYEQFLQLHEKKDLPRRKAEIAVAAVAARRKEKNLPLLPTTSAFRRARGENPLKSSIVLTGQRGWVLRRHFDVNGHVPLDDERRIKFSRSANVVTKFQAIGDFDVTMFGIVDRPFFDACGQRLTTSWQSLRLENKQTYRQGQFCLRRRSDDLELRYGDNLEHVRSAVKITDAHQTSPTHLVIGSIGRGATRLERIQFDGVFFWSN